MTDKTPLPTSGGEYYQASPGGALAPTPAELDRIAQAEKNAEATDAALKAKQDAQRADAGLVHAGLPEPEQPAVEPAVRPDSIEPPTE